MFQCFFFEGQFHIDLCSFLSKSLKQCSLPHIIIFHFDTTLIGEIDTFSLIKFTKFEFTKIHQIFPQTLLIFSEFLPVFSWFEKTLLFKNRIRKRLNRFFHKFFPLVGGFSFRHTAFDEVVSGFYDEDGVQLSDIGLDLFNLELADIISLGLARLGVATC